MIKVEFLKDIYYKGRVYKKGRILSINALDAEAMIKRGRAKKVEEVKPPPTKRKKSITIKKYKK